MSARDAFEKWAKSHDLALDPAKFPSSGATFDVFETEWSWNTWKSAWLAAKADDAEICRAIADADPLVGIVGRAASRIHDRRRGAKECVDAIRATIDGGR